MAHVKRLGPGIDKLADRSTPAIFVGYEEGAKAYRAYDPSSKRVIITRDVTFEEQREWDWATTANGDATPTVEHLVVTYSDEEHNELSSPARTGSPAASPAASATPISASSSSSGAAGSPPMASAGSTPMSVEDGWATPPDDDSERHDLDHTPTRYRKMKHVLAELDAAAKEEHAGLCLVAAEAPDSVDEALDEAS